MNDQHAPQQTAPEPYEPPVIVWEHEFIALAACSPTCQPFEVCVNDFCVPGGG